MQSFDVGRMKRIEILRECTRIECFAHFALPEHVILVLNVPSRDRLPACFVALAPCREIIVFAIDCTRTTHNETNRSELAHIVPFHEALLELSTR